MDRKGEGWVNGSKLHGLHSQLARNAIHQGGEAAGVIVAFGINLEEFRWCYL